MGKISRLLQNLKTKYLESFSNKLTTIDLERPIISFTFDDVPQSAFDNAVPILNRYGINGTFYVSGGLSNLNSEEETETSEKYLSLSSLRSLVEQKHQIGCHTYSHYQLNLGSAKGLYNDSLQNLECLKRHIGIDVVNHFSYPFGLVSFEEKRLLSELYDTMRSSRPGLNVGEIDLFLLRSVCIYSKQFDRAEMIEVIKEAVDKRAWLIFYTHGVQDSPGAFDCTPLEFEWLVEQCVATGADILPVNEAYKIIVK